MQELEGGDLQHYRIPLCEAAEVGVTVRLFAYPHCDQPICAGMAKTSTSKALMFATV